MTDLVLVSYLNTIPFLNGLQKEEGRGLFKINKRTPAECASMFINSEVDIALLPIGVLPLLPDHKIVTDYCIGCNGPVRTVVLFSNSPLHEINEVFLDTDSRTSYTLIKILMSVYYKKEIEYRNGIPSAPLKILDNQAILMIGDKVFEYEDKFKYKIDLGDAWKENTNLPFTFAVWVARPHVDDLTISKLNNLLRDGLAITKSDSIPNMDGIDLNEYFHTFISYEFDELKQQALNRYLQLGEKYILANEKVV